MNNYSGLTSKLNTLYIKFSVYGRPHRPADRPRLGKYHLVIVGDGVFFSPFLIPVYKFITMDCLQNGL